MSKIFPVAFVGVCCITPLMATDVYMGLDLSSTLQTIDGGITSELRETVNSAKLKVGFGEDNGFKYQFHVDYTRYSNPIFDTSNQVLYETAFDFIKEIEAQENISPYIKLSTGYGVMPIEGASKKHIESLLLTAGLGISFQTTKHLYVVTGFDYVARFWQDIDYQTTTSKTLASKSYGLGLYVGLNYKF